jgi:hypothetical protein
MDLKLSTQDLWTATALFGFLGLVSLAGLALATKNTTAERVSPAIPLASALFWGALGAAFMLGYWDLYYAYFYPDWVRWLTPLNLALYALIGLGLWHLGNRMPGAPWLWFAALGSLEGVGEHLLGIYTLRILDKVPWLVGLSAGPVLVFSFFEYLLYWTLVAWLALGLSKLMG